MSITEKLIGLATIAARTSGVSRNYMLRDTKDRLLILLDDIDRELGRGPVTMTRDCLAERKEAA